MLLAERDVLKDATQSPFRSGKALDERRQIKGRSEENEIVNRALVTEPAIAATWSPLKFGASALVTTSIIMSFQQHLSTRYLT